MDRHHHSSDQVFDYDLRDSASQQSPAKHHYRSWNILPLDDMGRVIFPMKNKHPKQSCKKTLGNCIIQEGFRQELILCIQLKKNYMNVYSALGVYLPCPLPPQLFKLSWQNFQSGLDSLSTRDWPTFRKGGRVHLVKPKYTGPDHIRRGIKFLVRSVL